MMMNFLVNYLEYKYFQSGIKKQYFYYLTSMEAHSASRSSKGA